MRYTRNILWEPSMLKLYSCIIYDSITLNDNFRLNVFQLSLYQNFYLNYRILKICKRINSEVHKACWPSNIESHIQGTCKQSTPSLLTPPPPPFFLRSACIQSYIVKLYILQLKYYLRKSVDCAWPGFVTIYMYNYNT